LHRFAPLIGIRPAIAARLPVTFILLSSETESNRTSTDLSPIYNDGMLPKNWIEI